jgi:hypothetical protein
MNLILNTTPIERKNLKNFENSNFADVGIYPDFLGKNPYYEISIHDYEHDASITVKLDRGQCLFLLHHLTAYCNLTRP